MRSSARVVAVIPARAGSKGIPGKNLMQVAGRSLVARAVDSAGAAGLIDAVYVSTDGEEIAAARAGRGKDQAHGRSAAGGGDKRRRRREGDQEGPGPPRPGMKR